MVFNRGENEILKLPLLTDTRSKNKDEKVSSIISRRVRATMVALFASRYLSMY